MIIVVAGVAGAGKTTLGEALAARLKVPFLDGDTLHPPANVAKMSAGQPLTDADRAPWLAALRAWMDGEIAAGRSAVTTCSALKRPYRARLAGPGVRFVLLTGPRDVLEARLTARPGHFFPASLLDSQLAALEPAAPGEDVLTLTIGPSTDALTDAVIAALGLAP
ncbi:MAG: gluconokinase [Caulobacteraceae bacterium]